MPALLQITSASGSSKVFIQSAKLVVGSGAESDIKLEDPKVSKAHCAIVKTAEGYSVMNLAGQAGTAVNGKAVTRAALKDGDVITMGGTRMVFGADGKPAGGTAPVARAATGAVKRPAATTALQAAKTIPMKAVAAGGGGTQAVAKATGRTPSAKVARPTGAVAKPATGKRPVTRARRPADKRRDKHLNQYLHGKKKPVWPVVLLVAVVMGSMIGVGIYFAPRSGGDESKKALMGAKQLAQSAAAHQSKGELQEALADLQRAMKLAEEAGEEGATTLASLKTDKQGIEGLIATAKAAQIEFDAVKAQFEKGVAPDDLEAFKANLGELSTKYKESKAICPWLEQVNGYLVQIDLQITQRNQSSRQTWGSFRDATVTPLMEAGKFAEARTKVGEQMEKFKPNDQRQARAFVEALPKRAEEWWRDTGSRELRKKQRENDFDGAQKYLEGIVPNVAGTPVEAILKGILEQVKQKKWPA